MKRMKLAFAAIIALSILLPAAPFTRAADAPKEDAKPAAAQAGPRAGARIDPLKTMDEQLKLTDAQKEQLKPILKEQAEKTRELRRDTSLSREDRTKKSTDLRKEYLEKINKILTADQKEKWAQYQKELQAKRGQGGQGGQRRQNNAQ